MAVDTVERMGPFLLKLKQGKCPRIDDTNSKPKEHTVT